MSAATVNPTAELLDWSNERYHSDCPNSVSHSELDAFIDSPEFFHGRYISKRFPGERTKPLEFGSVFHEIGLGTPFECGPDNYSHHTIANFHLTAATPDRAPDHHSGSGSKYWYTEAGLVRESNHWGEVGGCFWNLFGWTAGIDIGFCPWSHFHYSETFVPIPSRVLSKSGSRAGKAWEDFEAEHYGATLFKPEEFDPIAYMLDAIYAEPMARNLIKAPGQCEKTIRWTDEHTGLVRRAKLDKWIDGVRIKGVGSRRLIVDIKTAASVKPRKCSSMAEEHGYHRQVAYYQDAIEALTGERLPFVFIFIQKSPPYTVAVFDLDDEFVEMGRRQNQEHLRRLAKAFATKDWRESTHGKIFTISAPTWAHAQSSWEVPDDGNG